MLGLTIILLFVFSLSNILSSHFFLFFFLISLGLCNFLWFYFVSYASLLATTLFCLFFSSCLTIHNMYFWLVTVYHQMMLYHFVYINFFPTGLCIVVTHFSCTYVINPTIHYCYFCCKQLFCKEIKKEKIFYIYLHVYHFWCSSFFWVDPFCFTFFLTWGLPLIFLAGDEFWMSKKVFILPLLLKVFFPGYRNLSCFF